jgi:hydroxymethylpyrimidine/phosphomethylpyrimidine kinase
MRTALTIAGSDSGAGAGVQADLKTFAAHGVYGTSVITAVTAQNTLGVNAVCALSADLVTAQLEAVMSDIGAHAAKTGMLATAAIAEAVAAAVDDLEIPLLVVDPVMVATSGQRLLDEEALATMKAELISRAFIVTPNVPEAETLSSRPIREENDLREAARRILVLGPSAVLIKGGHFPSTDIVDLLYDGHRFTEFRAERVDGPHTHGTGCTFSAALTAQLALGRTLEEAIPLAQEYVAGAIRRAPGLGRGHGPLNHFWRSDRSDRS